MRYVTALILLFVFNGSLFSQGNKAYKIINSNQLIVGVDTLRVGVSKLQDHFSQKQIDSLGFPLEVEWDGDCDSGNYRSYWIKNKDYNLTYNSDFEEEFYLDIIEINLNDDLVVSLGDSLQLDYRSNTEIPILGSLELINDYYSLDTTFLYKQEGLWIKIYKNNDDVRILSMNLHSKDSDYISKKDFKVSGKIYNDESIPLPGVLLLGYTDSDSLVQFESSDLEGGYFLRSDKVKTVDIVLLGYEVLKIDSIPEKGKCGDFCLKSKAYEVPSLSLFRSGIIEFDTTSYLKQFPVVRDVNKIDYTSSNGCWNLDFEPIRLSVGQPFDGFKEFYKKLSSSINYRRQYKNKEIYIWFKVTKYGKIELEQITGNSKLINDEIAKAFAISGDWSRFRMRGRQMDVRMKMKLSFK